MSTDAILAICLLAVAGTAGCILWLTALDARRAKWLAENPEEAERLCLEAIARRQARENRERAVRP